MMLHRVAATKCGVGWDEQIVEQVPVESHDIVLDCILTPTRWRQVPPFAPGF
jgi:5-formyltetrahydrofolate cyclo-ligase